MELTINGAPTQLDVEPEMPLLWAIREQAGLTGTKFGCGIGACGACTVLLDGVAVRSCSFPVSAAQDSEITTIEGGENSQVIQALQDAWIEHQVPQCGYCQSGMIMAVTALLTTNSDPSDAEIDASISNICRCGTYTRIRAATHTAARNLEVSNG